MNKFWKDKTVFVTGHSGFKGGWASFILQHFGANVIGYSLPPATEPSLFKALNIERKISKSTIGNILDEPFFKQALTEACPDIVLHFAAQPLVRTSYLDPKITFETNVIGTLNLLQICRNIPSVKAIIVVTSDKCYENKEWLWPYRETDRLGGFDPYSNSKACTELVTQSMARSFYADRKIIATVRAGNVIGGGDWSDFRLVPDLVRALISNSKLELRNPTAIRPWQHVFEPLHGYFLLAEKLFLGHTNFAEAWNFGPNASSEISVDKLVSIFEQSCSRSLNLEITRTPQPHEANHLSLDSSKARGLLDWHSNYKIEEAIQFTIDWYLQFYRDAKQIEKFSEKQILRYFEGE